MSLINLVEANLQIGQDHILQNASLSIEEGQKLCLVGRNGTGKSTLLKVLDGSVHLDSGRIIKQQGLVVARLMQDPPLDITGNAYDVVCQHAGQIGTMLYALKHETDEQKLHDINNYIETHNGWELHAHIQKTLNLLKIAEDQNVEDLSGGMRRKLALASCLVLQPHLLLLDEPTNHLDIDSIIELEDFIKSYKGTVLVISHDRAFCDSISTCIIELDRGKLYSYPYKFDKYIEYRNERLRTEEIANKNFDKELALAEAWIRRGVKARLARNEGRVRNLKQMREQRAARRDRLGKIKVTQNNAQRSGEIVFELDNINISFAGTKIIDNFSATIMRQDKIGIIGKNGCGKTTLVKALLGLINLDSGTIKQGSNLHIQYFSQYQEHLDLDKSLADNIADGKKEVLINGKAIHIVSYLKDFLFDTRRLNQKVKTLSGGEKNRLMLAKIFAVPSNVLILDEPTNDLDLETLELLEELIFEYKGTVIVISHDRSFIDKIATETYVFEGNGKIESIVGGYKEVLYYYKHKQQQKQELKINEAKANANNSVSKSNKDSNKLTFTQKHELAQLPQKIDELEDKLASIDNLLADADLYKDGGQNAAQLMQERQILQEQIDALYARFEELMEKSE